MDIGAPLLGAIGFRMPVLGKIAKDFAAYFDDKEYAAEARRRLREKLCAMMDRGDKIMLISHGTGSVVAYDVLWELVERYRRPTPSTVSSKSING